MTLPHIALTALVAAAFSAPAAALDFTMNFDGITAAGTPDEGPNSEYGSAILGYYNGDPGEAPTFPRAGNQNWDVTFASTALAITPEADGGIGQFDTAKSPPSAAGSLTNNGVRFDLTTGLYISQMSFWYNAGGTGSNPIVIVYSGGVEVDSRALSLCAQPGPDGFCGWTEYVFSSQSLQEWAGNGQYITGVTLGGNANRVVYDDVFLSTAAVPEPSTYALMLGGLALVAGVARRRRT